VEAASDAQTVWVNTACVKITAIKICQTDTVISQRSLNNKIASYVWETDNLVHKLTTDKPQPVLINALIRAIFEH